MKISIAKASVTCPNCGLVTWASECPWCHYPLSRRQAVERENVARKTESRAFYLFYKQAVGSPPTGQQRAWLKVYDGDFNLIQGEIVKTTGWGPSGGEIRPSLEVSGNRVFSGQSSGKGIGQGNAEIYVYEVK
jgi:hypothetical protein